MADPRKPPRPPQSSPSIALADGPIASRTHRSDLAEVEEALSLLDGRHPEFARAEREKAQAQEKRKRQLDAEASRDRRVRRRRLLTWGILVVALGSAGYAAQALIGTRQRAIDAADRLAAPFRALGFTEQKPSPLRPWASVERLRVTVPAGVCLVAVGADAAGAPASLQVDHDGDDLEALGTVGFCTCAPETLTVTRRDAGGSVRLLQRDAAAFRGVLGFAQARPRPAVVVDSACTEEHVDGWLRGRGGAAAPSAAAPVDGRLAALTAFGFAVDARAASRDTLVPVPLAAGECAVAVTALGSPDTLALRVEGGQKPFTASRDAVAACSKAARTLAVWHEGDAPVQLVRGSAARIGGRRGLIERWHEAGFAVRAHVDAADQAWDAELTLKASRIAPITTAEWASGTKPRSEGSSAVGVAAFSLAEGVAANAVAEGAACDPDRAAATTLVCVRTGGAPWAAGTGGRGAYAFGALPLWMKPLAEQHAPEATRAAATLLAWTRRHVALGFEPTPLEAIVETASGAEVLGRAREDAVLALALQRSPPYVVPLTDGPPWRLDGPSRVVPLAPGARIVLRARGALEAEHRTIVFRRAAGSPP